MLFLPFYLIYSIGLASFYSNYRINRSKKPIKPTINKNLLIILAKPHFLGDVCFAIIIIFIALSTFLFKNLIKVIIMLSLQTKIDQKDITSLLQAYSLFSGSQNYQQKNIPFKKNIQNGDLFIIRVVINAIKNILTYRDIVNLKDIAKIQNFTEINNVLEEQNCINLNEFSKLLALRFLRETYFEPNYLFMNYANLQLSDIMLRIGLFKKQSTDEERGRYMFQAESKLFIKINNQARILKKIDKQIETIGYSIHKIALEILFTCGQLTHYLPFHEQFVNHENAVQNERFNNGFYSAFERLRQQQVKFPSKFHYFKEKDSAKFSSQYLKTNSKDQIQQIFKSIFQQIWMIIQGIIGNDYFQQNNLYIYLLTFTQASPSHLNDKLQFCSKLVLQTCDRYFWKYFNEFLDNKITQLKNTLQFDESLTQKELKTILGLHLFILFFNYHLLQPEIMYLIEHKYVKELSSIFLIILRFYGKISQMKESQGYRRGKSAKALPLQGNLTCMQVLKSAIFCFRRIKQFSIQFTHHFHQKLNTNHSYPFISLYSDIVMQIEPQTNNKMDEISEYKGKVERNIIERMSSNHEFYFKKQEFLFIYYEKASFQDHNLKQTKEQFKLSIQKILNKYQKFIHIVKIKDFSPLIQYINIQKQSIAQQQIDIVPLKNTDKLIKSRFSYRLNFTGNQKRFHSEDKDSLEMNSQKLPSIKSAICSPLSFVQSLKVNISKPNETLVKSLSSSRKLRKKNYESTSHVKSYSSKELSQFSQSISLQPQIQGNALPPFSKPPEFKQVFIDNCQPPTFQRSLQSVSTPIKSSLKRVHKINRNNQMVSTRYINNFISENKNYHLTEPKKICIQDGSQQTEQIRENHTQFMDNSSKAEGFERKIQTEIPIKELINDKKMSYIKSVQQFEREQIKSSKQIIQQQSLKQQASSETTMCFFYTPKAKKELLKKKVLVKKHGCLEVGMIVNLQQDIITNQLSTIKRYAILIKIYISALVPIQKVNVNIKFPNWLECISKANLSQENLKEQSQFISTFIVELKSTREKIIKRNYGQLPVINVVYVDRCDKREVISEPLYILVNRFSIEKTFNEDQFFQLMQSSYKISLPFLVHERIATDIKSIKQYYPSLSMFNLEASEKMQLFEQQDIIAGDSIGVVKIQFVKNHQQILLIFFEGKMQASTSTTSHGRSYLFVQLSPLKQGEWSYEQLHIFQTCLRSILSSDR